MLDGTEYFECTCYSDEHEVKFILSLDDDPEIYLSVYMDNRRGFWRRLWYGIRYAFGYQSKYGAFGNWTLRTEDASRLRGLLDQLIAVQDKSSATPRLWTQTTTTAITTDLSHVDRITT